jgi:hypothetical protein
MNRLVLTFAMVCVFASTVIGQSLFNGNWSTDPVPQGWAGWSDTGKPNTFKSQPSIIEPRKARPLNPNVFPAAVFITLKVEGSNVSGFLGVNDVWDLPMKGELGKIEAKIVRFMTVRPVPGRDPLYWLWTAELKDDNTMLLHRANINVAPGGVAPVALPPPLTTSANNDSLTLHRVGRN